LTLPDLIDHSSNRGDKVEKHTGRSIHMLHQAPTRINQDVQARIDAIKIGQKMQDLPAELQHDSFKRDMSDGSRRGGPSLRIIKMDPSKPSLTVTAYIYNKFVHPWENRYITPLEAARLQDIPDGYLMAGTDTSIREQVGNAVPSRLASAVGRTILEHAIKHGTLKDHMVGCDDEIPYLSLFSGAGILDFGFRGTVAPGYEYKFKPIMHIESNPDCCDTLTLNSGMNVSPTNIRDMTSPMDYVKSKTGHSSIPIVIGGPPCQAFSQAGKQKAELDDRGTLIREFTRVVASIMPSYFVMENVPNLKGVGGGALFRSTLSKFGQLGYNTSQWKLCAAHYGTAQLRWRWFIVGTMDRHNPVDRPQQTHFDYRTVWDAFQGLPPILSRRGA